MENKKCTITAEINVKDLSEDFKNDRINKIKSMLGASRVYIDDSHRDYISIRESGISQNAVALRLDLFLRAVIGAPGFKLEVSSDD